MSAPTFAASNATIDIAGRRELHAQTIHLAIDAVLGLSLTLFVVAAFVLDRGDPELFAVTTGLVIVAGSARVAGHFAVQLAAIVLVVGLMILFAIASFVLPAAVVAPWLILVALTAGALLGWRWGVVTVLAVSSALLLGAERAWIPLAPEVALSVVLVSGCALFFSWLLGRPTDTALDWAWSSYSQTLSLIHEARVRQAELVQLTKSLSESYYHLEQLNLDLDRARRAAQEARRLKAQFAAAVSHELRTPLNLVIGFCEMMVLSPTKAYDQRLPSAYREDLEAIYRNACHISSLVDDILDLSQIDADRMALHREWTTLGQIIEEAVAPVASLFRNRALSLEVTLGDNLPPVFVDRTRIRQILINLLNNAARVTEVGGVTVNAYREGTHVVVAVADTGPGIGDDDLPYIFEEFHQASGTTRRRGGSGLGLTVSRRFAELHHGSLDATSVLGQGSTFRLCLPIDENVVPDAVAKQSWDERLASRVHGEAERRVLVVDTAGEVSNIFRRYLDGYRVLDVGDLSHPGQGGSGDGGEIEPAHAVIVGSVADQARWLDLARALPALQRLPIISCPLQTARRTAEELGAHDYLVKPITRDHLRAVVRRMYRKPRDLRTMLIVDDDTEVLRLLGRMARSLFRGCRVLAAEDGQQALSLMREQRPDVVLLDLLMPVLDGYGLLDVMRADPHLRDVPVLVVTAEGMHGDVVTAPVLSVSREGGLTVAEVMRWLKVGLDALLAPGTSDAAPQAEPAA